MECKTVARAQKTPSQDYPTHHRATKPRPTPHPSHDLQRYVGNQAVQRLFNSPCMRARLTRPAGDQLVEEEVGFMAQDVARRRAASTPALNAPAASQEQCPECAAGRGSCSKCVGDNGGPATPPATTPSAPVPAQAAPTYTFISRGSYGETFPNFTPPSCVAVPPPGTGSTLVAGSASPTSTIFPNGTYQVRRDSDGVQQTATCTRLAAGLAATQAHENSHANGARNAAAAANTAAGLPQNHATGAACSAALPAIVAAWNASVNAAWTIERTHGPGTQPPTPQTFTQENAAGTCTFV